MFSQRLVRNSSVIAPIIGILASTNNKDRAHCRETTDKDATRNNTLFEGQCLKRQLYIPQFPYPAWDYNWDGRMSTNTTLEALSSKPTAHVQGKTRHVIFIRHGQYDETHNQDDKRVLTKLGRIQAHRTGQRLAIMMKGLRGTKFGPCRMVAIYSSDMVRAKETATIIATYLPGVPLKEPDAMLNEALPAPIIPVRPEIHATNEIDDNASRIEAAFHQYMYRAPPQEEEEHEFIIIVGHGNVIRYMFCRALQIPPEVWLRMSIFNCSMTYLMIKPNGYCSCRLLGDVGHLGYEHTTFSNGYGFSWS